jgi:hypothetical protein
LKLLRKHLLLGSSTWEFFRLDAKCERSNGMMLKEITLFRVIAVFLFGTAAFFVIKEDYRNNFWIAWYATIPAAVLAIALLGADWPMRRFIQNRLVLFAIQLLSILLFAWIVN